MIGGNTRNENVSRPENPASQKGADHKVAGPEGEEVQLNHLNKESGTIMSSIANFFKNGM